VSLSLKPSLRLGGVVVLAALANACSRDGDGARDSAAEAWRNAGKAATPAAAPPAPTVAVAEAPPALAEPTETADMPQPATPPASAAAPAAPTATPAPQPQPKPSAPPPPVQTAAVAPTSLPAGPGRDTTARVCTACHGQDALLARGRTRAGWSDVIAQMQNLGLSASDEELDEIEAYLARALPPR